jgi:hypothetical protein
MNYSQEYQRGPLHLGRIEMNFRAYAWTDKEIESYKKMREREAFELIGVIDSSVKSALEAFGDEMMRYLKEAGEEFDEKKELPKAPSKSPGILESLLLGFGDMFSLKSKKSPKKPKQPTQTQLMKMAFARKEAESTVKRAMWNLYHSFKKEHEMLNW